MDQRSKLQIALMQHDQSESLRLIDEGENINAIAPDGRTTLQVALANHMEEVALKMLEMGIADLDNKAPDGRTTLQIALANHMKRAALKMIDMGITDLGVKDPYGRTTAEVARANNHIDIAEKISATDRDRLTDIFSDMYVGRDKGRFTISSPTEVATDRAQALLNQLSAESSTGFDDNFKRKGNTITLVNPPSSLRKLLLAQLNSQHSFTVAER